jgi:hypothetical protein
MPIRFPDENLTGHVLGRGGPASHPEEFRNQSIIQFDDRAGWQPYQGRLADTTEREYNLRAPSGEPMPYTLGVGEHQMMDPTTDAEAFRQILGAPGDPQSFRLEGTSWQPVGFQPETRQLIGVDPMGSGMARIPFDLLPDNYRQLLQNFDPVVASGRQDYASNTARQVSDRRLARPTYGTEATSPDLGALQMQIEAIMRALRAGPPERALPQTKRRR